MSKIVQEKVNQAIGILDELNIDAWLTFVRETSAMHDPVLDLIYGHDLTWQSALILSKSNQRYAIVGQFEAETVRLIDAYDCIIPYNEAMSTHLINVLQEINPETIALNYSTDDVLSDGLSYGMYKILMKYLSGTPWIDRLISAENIIRSLRGRKTPEEIKRIKDAILTTHSIYQKVFEFIQPGYSEIEVSNFFHSLVKKYRVETAWEYNHCPTINVGPDSPIGHVQPTDIKIKRGQIVHFDFGIKKKDYCSDIQRVVYFLNQGEKYPPDVVTRGFNTIVQAIQTTAGNIAPGMTGKEVDAISRRIVTDAGYPEYKYATGHHVGRLAHDGAGVLGPEWERYRDTPNYKIEPGNVYTLEPGLMVPGYGYIGLEEMILITDSGSKFLSIPQSKLIVL